VKFRRHAVLALDAVEVVVADDLDDVVERRRPLTLVGIEG